MSKFHISDFYIYRWRYIIGYSLIGIGIIGILLAAGIFVPGGITSAEMKSAVISDAVKFSSLSTLSVVNLPYHLLQNLCLNIFGVSIISIKLPSIILAIVSAVSLIFLLRRWFKPSIGVLSSIIAIATSQFIFIAQDGTPNILYIFYPICLLLLATIIIGKNDIMKKASIVKFGLLAALCLYTPLNIYALIAFALAVLLHPHLRCLIKQLPRLYVILGLIIFGLVSLPLIAILVKMPSVGLELLGLPNKWPNLIANLGSLMNNYFNFARPGGSTIMTPYFELGSMLLIGIGLYSTIRNRETSKSYIILFWIICLLPIMIISPKYSSAIFVPLILLLASGINSLLMFWYGLFPNNPYARIGGLIPIVILVLALVFSGIDRYVYGYLYNPDIVPNFSKDLELLPSDTKNLVVSEGELDFYKVVASHKKGITVSTQPLSDNFTATHNANKTFASYEITNIITSRLSNDGDRFYLYQKITD